jgi:ComEC/Rec2-related protein
MVLGILSMEAIGGGRPGLVGLGLLAAAFLTMRSLQTARGVWAVGLGWMWAGSFSWWLECTPLHPADVRIALPAGAIAGTLRGRVVEMPTLRLSGAGGSIRPRTTVALEVAGWRGAEGVWEPLAGRVLVATRGAPPRDLFPGQAMEVEGLLQPVPGAVAPGLFDYRQHLKWRGIFRLLEVDSFRSWRRLDPILPKAPWSVRFVPWAQRALAYGVPDDESTRLLWAMTLGWRTALSEETGAAFVEAGTMHVFAISGLHIALLTGALVALLRLFRMSRAACGWVVLPALWFYVAATGWQPSAVRSGLMMSVIVGGWALHRPSEAINSLALAALGLLIVDPGQVFQPGFQLSFAAVAGLAHWVPRWVPAWQRAFTPPPESFLPDELQSPWRKRMDALLGGLGQGLAVTAAASLATLPFTLHSFHVLSPVSLVANLVIVPLSGLPLAANLASLLTFGWWPGLAGLFNAAAWLWMGVLVELSRAFARCPGGVWFVAAPPMAVWVGLLGLVLTRDLGWFQRPLGIGLWRAVAAGGAAGWVLFGIGSTSGTHITVLPRGAVVIDARGRQNDWVLNTGGAPQVSRVLIPWMRAHGWNALPRWAITQADAAHTGGATNVLNRWKPAELIVGARRQRSPIHRGFLSLADQEGLRVVEVLGDVRMGDWTVEGPPSAAGFRTAADNALVLTGRPEGIGVMILPEMGPDRLDRLRPTGIEVLIAEVSDRNAAALRRCIESAAPQWAVVSRSGPPLVPGRSPARWLIPGVRVIELGPAESAALTLRAGKATIHLPSGETLRLTSTGSRVPVESGKTSTGFTRPDRGDVGG